MKKITKILFLLFLTTQVATSQTGWFQQNSGGIAYYYSVFFINDLTGWAAGVDTISKTTNGGNNWVSTQLSGLDLRSIFFVNSNTGFTVGKYAKILKTTNGGGNWVQQVAPLWTYNLYSVFFINEMTGWACGGSTPISNSMADSICGIIKTTDGGSNWFSVFTHVFSYDFEEIQFIDAFTGWVCHMGDIRKTTNGGNNWSSFPIYYFARLHSIFFINSLTGWTPYGGYDTVYKTTDSGNNWKSIPIGISGGWRSVRFTNSVTGWIVGSTGSIIKTTDGGLSWGVQSSGTVNQLRSVFFVIENTGWVIGNGGTILKTTNGGGPIVGIIPNSEVPKEFSLSQNYPNPFNPVTKIKFNIKIFNTLDNF